jgi:hypothetical protein
MASKRGCFYADISLYRQYEFEQEQCKEGHETPVEAGANRIVIQRPPGKPHAPTPKEGDPQDEKHECQPVLGSRRVVKG